MQTKTNSEITAEIAKLRAIKPRLPEINGMNDNNHHAVDAQVEVLEAALEGRDLDAAADDHDDDDSSIYDAARDAANWVNGESEYESLVDGDGWASCARD
jgi:hypothetical protein